MVSISCECRCFVEELGEGGYAFFRAEYIGEPKVFGDLV
jgi:hypothetical protein